MEPCSRAIVLSSQVLNGMWRRNGYGVQNQAVNYQQHSSAEIMYKKDIVMLQVEERERESESESREVHAHVVRSVISVPH